MVGNKIEDIILGVKITIRLPKNNYLEVHFEKVEDINKEELNKCIEKYSIENKLIKDPKAYRNPWEGRF